MSSFLERKKEAIAKASVSVPLIETALVDTDNEIGQWIESVKQQWGNHVFQRMDEDEKLWTLEPYVYTDAKGEVPSDVINVTMNDARVFGERVLAVLNETQELIEIKGQRDGKELSGHESKVIEDWWTDLIYVVNETLNLILLPDLDAYLWEQIAIRGRMGCRVLLSEDMLGFSPDIVPIDMRKCIFSVGQRGLSRVAFWDTLDKDASMEQYPAHRPVSGTVLRCDYWDNSHEVVFLDGKFYDAVPNKLGHPPFVIQFCQQGTFFDTSTRALRMRGESIFAANRQLYPELNRIATIMETQNALTIAPPQVLKSESGEKLPEEPVYRSGRILALKTTEDMKKIEAPDIQSSTRFFSALLNGALQRGSLSHSDWGNLQFQLSQVAIATLAGASKQVFTPRVKTMERFKRLLCREAMWQFRAFDMTASIGRTGKKYVYTAKDLSGDYTVDFEYQTALPEETAAAYGLATMAQRWMDDKTIRKTILKYRDYDDIDEKYLIQTAQKVSKALMLFEMAKSLEKQNRKDEAKLLLIELGQVLEGGTQRELIKLTNIEVPEASPEQKAQALMIGAGGSIESAVRTTRKMEPPGAGELEQEVAA